PEPEPELELEPEPGLEPEPEPEAEPEPEWEPEVASDPELEAEPEPGSVAMPAPPSRSPFGSASDWGTDAGEDWGGPGRWPLPRPKVAPEASSARGAADVDDDVELADDVQLADEVEPAGADPDEIAVDVDAHAAGPEAQGANLPLVGRASRRPRPRAGAADDGVGPGAPPAWRGLGPQPAPPWDRRQQDDAPGETHLPGDTPPIDVGPDLPPAEHHGNVQAIGPLDAGEAVRLVFEERRGFRELGHADEDAATRVRRRGVLLVLLAIAVAGFVLSQWWVASRAGATFDVSAGFHAYRDGDFAAARRHWERLAAAGDPTAQFMLGYLAEAGLGAPWSARAAAAWYRTAAEAGHAEAAWRLGRLYEAGLGVAPDDGEARRWFRAAADGGHGEAAFAWATSWMRELGIVWARDGVEVWPAGVLDELSEAFERATALGFHEAAPYAASLAAARSAGLGSAP
ncbi:MAG: tetratricopeptide repeat protein, partial [Trueperaceae bacterium]